MNDNPPSLRFGSPVPGLTPDTSDLVTSLYHGITWQVHLRDLQEHKGFTHQKWWVFHGLLWFNIFFLDDHGIMMGEYWDIDGYTLW